MRLISIFAGRRSVLAAALLLGVGALPAVTQAQPPAFSKAFTDDPVRPGDTVTLQFTLINLDRDFPATGLAFTDDLDAALTGLTAIGLPLADPCGAGSQLSGTTLLTFSGGSLPAAGSCTFSVTLQVPPAAAPDIYTNTTSALSGTIDGTPVAGVPAVEQLFVKAVPLFSKQFTDSPAIAGGTATLEFSITNTSATDDLDGIAFSDALAAGLTATGLPAADVCGTGSVLAGTTALSLTDGSLGPGASCTFQVILDVDLAVDPGTYTNTTSALSGLIASEDPVEAAPASDDLVVLAAPRLSKHFSGDPAPADSFLTLEFTLALDPNAPAAATDIAWSDDLEAALPSLSSIGLPLADVCGPGSQIAGDPGPTNLVFTGGSLAPGESCTFAVTLLMPAGAAPGGHLNTTSAVSATMLATTVASPPASDTLEVASLSLAKSFAAPAVPGGTVALQFTLENLNPAADAGAISFTDDLDAVLSGLVATGLPAAACGGTLSGTSTLTFAGGSLAAGAACSFTVTLQIPAGAASGEYPNLTSTLAAEFDGEPFTAPRATDSLTVADPLAFSKSFTDDPAVSPGTVTLQFTIANADPFETATALAFTDDLDAALAGLVATGLPAAACGGTVTGTSTLTFAGGIVGAASSCTFSVSLQVPAGVPFGTIATNTTSLLTGLVGGVPADAGPASDELAIQFFSFTKSFDGPTVPGANPVLTFTIENLGGAASGLSFTDDLGTVLPGLVALGLPQNNVCGAGSQLAGTATLTLSGGALGAGTSCSFAVTLLVPAAAAAGTFLNTTSNLLLAGLPAAVPAAAALEVSAAAAPEVPVIPALAPWGAVALGALLALAALLRLGGG